MRDKPVGQYIGGPASAWMMQTNSGVDGNSSRADNFSTNIPGDNKFSRLKKKITSGIKQFGAAVWMPNAAPANLPPPPGFNYPAGNAYPTNTGYRATAGYPAHAPHPAQGAYPAQVGHPTHLAYGMGAAASVDSQFSGYFANDAQRMNLFRKHRRQGSDGSDDWNAGPTSHDADQYAYNAQQQQIAYDAQQQQQIAYDAQQQQAAYEAQQQQAAYDNQQQAQLAYDTPPAQDACDAQQHMLYDAAQQQQADYCAEQLADQQASLLLEQQTQAAMEQQQADYAAQLYNQSQGY